MAPQERNTPPADIWETLMRLRACNKQELAAAMGVSRHTLARWMRDEAGANAHARAAALLQQTLADAGALQHAWPVDWSRIATVAGKR